MLASLAGAGGLLSACADAPVRDPDVVLIVMDTTRVDRLGLYGHERDTTPRLDAFAESCEVFERAWSSASWTLPAHASLLTGLYVSAHGAHMKPGWAPDARGENPAHLVSSATTLAEILRDRGYATAVFAAAGWLAPEFGLLQGYEVKDAEFRRETVPVETVPAETITARAKAWMDGVPADQPLHLLVNYFDPHDPYRPAPDFDLWSAAYPKGAPLDPTADESERHEFLLRARERLLALYDGEIRYMDHHLGALLDHLRAIGRLENALVVITADHGEGFGDKAVGHAVWLYESLLRIPMIVHRPGGGGMRRSELVSIVDVMGIVAEEVGFELPEGVDSRPLGTRDLVIAEEQTSPLFRKLFSLERDVDAAIEWPYKVVAHRPGDAELYRLDVDPDETQNLADGEREQEILARLDAVLDGLTPLPPDESVPAVRPEVREHLRNLGYLE